MMAISYWAFRPVQGGPAHVLMMSEGDAARYAAAHGMTMAREW